MLVVDRSEKLSEQSEQAYENILEKYRLKIIVVHNKADLKICDQSFSVDGPMIQVSAKEGNQLEPLFALIEGILQCLDFMICGCFFLLEGVVCGLQSSPFLRQVRFLLQCG